MLSFTRIVSLSLLVFPIVNNAAASQTTPTTFNPVGLTLNPISYGTDTSRSVPLHRAPETNAERMKRGLGPKKPARINGRALLPRQSNTPPPPPPPPPPSYPTGYITARYSTFSGYLSAAPNVYGEYVFTPDRTAALKAELHNVIGEPFDIVALVRGLLEASLILLLTITLERDHEIPLRWSHQRVWKYISRPHSDFLQLCVRWRYLSDPCEVSTSTSR